MAYLSNNTQSPAAEYLYKLQMIVSNTEFKNTELAQEYETTESKLKGEKYVRAKLGTDSFESYTYDNSHIYQTLLDSGYPEDRIYLCLQNYFMIPTTIRRQLQLEARESFINSYVEENKYYCNLAGIPFAGNDKIQPDRIFTIPDEFFEIYAKDGVITQEQPIHTLPPKYQELFINSDYYAELIKSNPDATYLKYIGSNSIPIEVSRKTRDGEIMLINSNKLSGYHRKFGNVSVSPDIVNLFSNVYKQTRDYVYNTLRGNFSSIYPNYNNFIRFLTIYMAIGQSLNELMKASSSMAFLNNTSANNYFMLYGLPSVILEGQSMIDFLKKFRLLLMDKGTNIVYRVKDMVGYKYTDIFSLIMVKQQIFENGKPKYTYDAEGNPTPLYNIVFRRMGTTDDKTSYFRFKNEVVEYDWKEIASGDPRWWWWNDPDIDSILYEMNYTLSNSKYIQLSTHMSMSDIYWQSIILLRGLLDNRKETKFTPISINYDLGGISRISVFDAVLSLIIIMNWNMRMVNGKSFNGKLINSKSECIDMLFNGLMDDGLTPNPLKSGRLFKVSSFNFDILNSDFYRFELPTYEYLEPGVFIKEYLEPVLHNVTKNVGQVMMNETRKVYDYLVNKLLQTKTIHEFRQVTDTFKQLFLVDPNRTWYDETMLNTIGLLSKKYNISEQDIKAFQSFTSGIIDNPPFIVKYNDEDYVLDIGIIMNSDVKSYTVNNIAPFNDQSFVDVYMKTVDSYSSVSILESNLPNTIKSNYKGLMKDKVTLDLNTDTNGPDSFEGLLMMDNPKLYDRLITIKNEGTNLIYFMRAIIKGLETYTVSSLSALEFTAIGESEYISILKEIISYFKSYMVEFTKDEFIYVMDGLFDNGGNSNMLRLYDEIHEMKFNPLVRESISLYDVSNSTMNEQFKDDNINRIYDDAIIRAQAKYSDVKSLGYDILFDNGSRIIPDEPDGITDDSLVTGTLYNKNNSYAIVISTNMIDN